MATPEKTDADNPPSSAGESGEGQKGRRIRTRGPRRPEGEGAAAAPAREESSGRGDEREQASAPA